MSQPADQLRTMVDEALQHFKQGRFADAIQLCTRVLDTQPNTVAALQILGHAELKAGNVGNAVLSLRRATQLEGQNPQLHRDLAKAHMAAGDPRGAAAALEQAFRLAPTSMEIYDALLNLYIANGLFETGCAFFAELLRAAPTSVGFLHAFGRLKAEQGLAQDAVPSFEQAAARAPTSFAMKYWLGCALLQNGQYTPAIQAFAESLALPPSSAQEHAECVERKKDAEMLARLRPAVQAVRRGVVARPEYRDTWEEDAVAAIRAQIEGHAPAPMTAVFFHVDAGDHHPFLQQMSPRSKAVDYKNTLLQSCRAVAVTHPGAAVIVLTDAHSDLSVLGDAARVVRLEIAPNQLMYSRARANKALVAAKVATGPVLFLDTDILLNRDFTPVFDGSFDVGLTFRNKPGLAAMPVNEGVMMGAEIGSPALKRFFDDVLDIYEWLAGEGEAGARYGFDVRNWRGGQLSLAALVDWTVPPQCQANTVINGVRYKFLPCDDFNHAVSAADPFSALARKWAIHFKGAKAKALMEAYAAYAQKERTQPS